MTVGPLPPLGESEAGFGSPARLDAGPPSTLGTDRGAALDSVVRAAFVVSVAAGAVARSPACGDCGDAAGPRAAAEPPAPTLSRSSRRSVTPGSGGAGGAASCNIPASPGPAPAWGAAPSRRRRSPWDGSRGGSFRGAGPGPRRASSPVEVTTAAHRATATRRRSEAPTTPSRAIPAGGMPSPSRVTCSRRVGPPEAAVPRARSAVTAATAKLMLAAVRAPWIVARRRRSRSGCSSHGARP